MVEIDLEVTNGPARTSVTDLVDLVRRNALSRQPTILGPVMVETVLVTTASWNVMVSLMPQNQIRFASIEDSPLTFVPERTLHVPFRTACCN